MVEKRSKPGMTSQYITSLSGGAMVKQKSVTEPIPEVPNQDQKIQTSIEPESTKTKKAEPQQEAAPQEPKRPLAKSKDPNYKQTSVYLPKMLHIKLMAAAMEEDKDVSELFAELGEKWLKAKNLEV